MLLWKSKYEVGIERIDAQHHIFLNVIGEFQEACRQGASVDKLESILHEIALYARYHFYSEENIMRECGFPEINEHKNMHYQLLDDMNGRMLGMREGLSTSREVEEFLVQWFVRHTTQEDIKIGHHVRTASHSTAE